MNKAMLIEGLAWHYKDYSTSKEYSQLEDTARLVLIWIQYLFILIFWLLIINATTSLSAVRMAQTNFFQLCLSM